MAEKIDGLRIGSPAGHTASCRNSLRQRHVLTINRKASTTAERGAPTAARADRDTSGASHGAKGHEDARFRRDDDNVPRSELDVLARVLEDRCKQGLLGSALALKGYDRRVGWTIAACRQSQSGEEPQSARPKRD